MRKLYLLQSWLIIDLNISPNKHATAYIMRMLLNVKSMHHIAQFVASYLQWLCCTHEPKHFKVVVHFEKPESLLLSRVTKSITFTYDFVAALLSFWDFFSSVALSWFAWTETYFLSFTPLPPLFIANSNGANVVCHSLDPLWAVHTTGTFLLVSSTPRR